MKRFEIGDKVVALVSSTHPFTQTRIKGNVYTVEDILYCTKCGIQVINIGQKCKGNTGLLECSICGDTSSNRNLGWTQSRYFAKVDDLSEAIEEAVAEEDYETAALLRDIGK